ncbi:MAG: signal peptidase I [Niameybacter sp.]|uniref:signal peptidase I n=1 Tax=Niameybacter sp. TaxID=2033640 RepID=UPI002FC69B39
MQKLRNILDFSKDLLVALLAALLVIRFVAMHTEVPSGSMIPTIMQKDHLVVSPFTAYGRSPKIGEIVIFYEDGDRLVKRLIATGGDTVDLIDGDVYVNGEAIDESSYVRYEHTTYPFSWSDIEFPYTVPEGSYWMMGDNREESADSRVFGAVEGEKIIAIGGFRIYPFDTIGALK